MWTYKRPGFALLLLYELKKQQQSSLHCDTLLQTEGVSVPVHSSVLSALSPVFSRAISSCSSHPVGQSRLFKLQGVGACALVKLVRFLYSGEIEGEGLDEQQEVVDVAHRLGFSNLIDGLKEQLNGQQNSSTPLKKISEISASSHSNVRELSVPVHSECRHDIQKEKIPMKTDQLRKTHLRQNLNLEGDEPEALKPKVFETVKGVGSKDFRKLGFQSSTAFEQQIDRRISLKIKLKRKKRGALWEITSGSTVRCNALTGKKDIEEGDTLSQLQRFDTKTHLSPYLECTHLGPITHPSDLTLPPPASLAFPDPCTPCSNPPSSLLQNPSGMSETEESDEHIAKLLDDMVMMGLNILPSMSMGGNNNMHLLSKQHTSPEPHIDPKMEQSKPLANDTASCQTLWTGEFDVGHMTTSSGSECPGAKNNSRCGTVELKNSSLSSHPPSFSISFNCAASQKDIDPATILPYTASEQVLMTSLPFTTGGLKLAHQNVGQPTNVLDNVLLKVDDRVQSRQQTENNTSEGQQRNVQSSGTAAQDAFSSEDVTDLNEMRLPRCLSPLVSDAGKTLNPLDMPISVSAANVNLKPNKKNRIPSSDPQALSGQQDSSTHVKQKAKAALSSRSSEIRSDSCSSRSNKDYIKESEGGLGQNMTQNLILGGTKDNRLGLQRDQSGIKRMSSKRHNFGAVANEPNREKNKMPGSDSKGVDTQTTNKTPRRENGDTVAGISTAQCSDYPSCKKLYWLRTGKTVESTSTDQRRSKKPTHVQTNQSFKSKDQDECKIDVDKMLPAKRKRGRPPKKRKHAALQNLNKEKKFNSSTASCMSFTCPDKGDLQLTKRIKTDREFVQSQEHNPGKDKAHFYDKTFDDFHDKTLSNQKTADLNIQVSVQNIPLTRSYGSNSEMENDLHSEPIKISVHTEMAEDKTEDFQLKGSVDVQIVHKDISDVEKGKSNAEMETVRVMAITRMNERHGAAVRDSEVEVDENTQLTSGHGNEEIASVWRTEKTGMGESVMKADGESVPYEDELSGEQFQRTRVEIKLRDLPATIAKNALSVEHEEKTAPKSPLAVASVGENIEAGDQECDEDDEEVVVDDILSSLVFSAHSLLDSESITVKTEEEYELEEEEEVDVTGQDTD